MIGKCRVCGNECSYDKQSLKGSTWDINGGKIILCIPCEDELLKKIARGRGILITYGGGGEISGIKVTTNSIKVVYG
jgi:hypothetical protein